MNTTFKHPHPIPIPIPKYPTALALLHYSSLKNYIVRCMHHETASSFLCLYAPVWSICCRLVNCVVWLCVREGGEGRGWSLWWWMGLRDRWDEMIWFGLINDEEEVHAWKCYDLWSFVGVMCYTGFRFPFQGSVKTRIVDRFLYLRIVVEWWSDEVMEWRWWIVKGFPRGMLIVRKGRGDLNLYLHIDDDGWVGRFGSFWIYLRFDEEIWRARTMGSDW